MHGCNSREKNYNQKDELMEEDNQNIEDIFNENDTKSQTIAQFGLDLSVRTSLNVKFMSTMGKKSVFHIMWKVWKKRLRQTLG